MSIFLSDGLKGVVHDKWLLWDTSALIRVVDCDAEEVFEKLMELGISENVTIKPVILELGATGDAKTAVKRADYAERFITNIIKLNIDTTHDNTEKIQASMPAQSQPGAVDLMLASSLSQYNSKMLFITENIKDFPEPLFNKVGFLMVSNSGRSFGLTILKMDITILI